MKRLLYIEDERAKNSSLVDFLQDIYDWKVDLVTSVSAAMAAMRSDTGAIDAVLLDVMMVPDEVTIGRVEADDGRATGIVLVDHIRILLPNVPIVILTARSGVADMLESPVFQVLDKPQDAEDVARILNSTIGLRAANSRKDA